MADNITARDAGGTTRTLATKELAGNVHSPKHTVVKQTGAEVDFATQATLALALAAIQALAPAGGAIAVTPNDGTDLADVRGIYVGTGGDLAVQIGGANRTFKNVTSGSTLPIKATRVRATGTTATDILALT